MKLHPVVFTLCVIFVTILAAVFISPQLFDAHYTFRNWKLGLDLVGGSHLVYEVDLSGVKAAERASVVIGLRDVIEKRVNLFGVSEPQVYTAKSGDVTRLVVELAGIKELSKAIEQIGATPFLYFAERKELETADGKKITAYQHSELTLSLIHI